MSVEDALRQLQAQVGQEVGVSRWITVDQPMIDQFAATTQDDQWIHTDPARAARDTPFGGTIAHGFLTLSLASRFAYDCFDLLPGQVMGINYGFDRIRFLAPVPAGSRLRGRFVLSDATQRSAREVMRRMALTIEMDGHDTPALVADWLNLAVFADGM
ncbi:MAG: MaoC family dehydratase [Pseudomonadota bacterium]